MRVTTLPMRSTWLVAGLLAALVLTACSGRNWFSYTGWEAKPDNRYELKQGGPHAVVWHSTELDLKYRYRLEDNQLHIEGEVIRNNRIKHFDQLKAWINIHLLDENGIILDTHRLWSVRGSGVYGWYNYEFEHIWNLPPENEAVGFSFSGDAGSSGENSSEWRFWQTP